MPLPDYEPGVSRCASPARNLRSECLLLLTLFRLAHFAERVGKSCLLSGISAYETDRVS